MLQHLHKWLGGTVQNGNLDGIDVDVDVVDSAGVDGCEEVFCGGQKDSLFHEAGGVADAGDVVALSFNREVVQVQAPENDAGFRRCRYKAYKALYASVEAHTFQTGFSGYCCLEHSPV